MTFRLRVPRPAQTKAYPQEYSDLEKKLASEVEQIQVDYPDATIELWCEDEHRVGLKPILKRVYVPEGENPIAQVNWRFKWLWLYAFVHPQSGETYWWIVPYVNIDVFTTVLADFAKEFGIGREKRVLLVLDRALLAYESEISYSRRDSFVALTVTFS